uniref:Uncharacterized protein n=1 Tax=Cacopsylla melanoneura TaxID=428564 RepID=A0A8D8Q1Q3_9HEMI
MKMFCLVNFNLLYFYCLDFCSTLILAAFANTINSSEISKSLAEDLFNLSFVSSKLFIIGVSRLVFSFILLRLTLVNILSVAPEEWGRQHIALTNFVNSGHFSLASATPYLISNT